MDIRDFGPRRNAKEFEFITDRRNKAFDPPYTGHSLPLLLVVVRQVTADYGKLQRRWCNSVHQLCKLHVQYRII